MFREFCHIVIDFVFRKIFHAGIGGERQVEARHADNAIMAANSVYNALYTPVIPATISLQTDRRAMNDGRDKLYLLSLVYYLQTVLYLNEFLQNDADRQLL